MQKQYEYHRGGVVCKAEPGDVAIDCGACWGETTVYFAHEVGAQGRVLSFEFIPTNLAVLRRNLEANLPLAGRIDVVENPLWMTSGNTLYYVDWGPGSRVSPDPSRYPGADRCSTVSIDDAVSTRQVPRVDFIKMDIEGAELPSLKGAERTLRAHRPKLAISLYHQLSDFVTIPRYLESLEPRLLVLPRPPHDLPQRNGALRRAEVAAAVVSTMSGEPGAPVYIRIAADGTRWPGSPPSTAAQRGAGGRRLSLPFADDSVAGAYVDHVLERLDLPDGARLLHEVRRVLARGGRARVVTDDLGRRPRPACIVRCVGGGAAGPGTATTGVSNAWRCSTARFASRGDAGCTMPPRSRVSGPRSGCASRPGAAPRESADPHLAGREGASEADLIVELEKPRRTDGERPLVSVLVPLHRTTYLERTIASVLDQTYDNFEVVIRDDGPPAAPRRSCEGSRSTRGFNASATSTTGTASASRTTSSPASGRPPAHTSSTSDDDDLLAPRCLEVMAACLRDHPNVTLVTSHRELIDAGGSALPPKSVSERPVGRSSIISGRSAIARVLSQELDFDGTACHAFIGEPSTVMFRKADIETATPDFWSLGGINFQGNATSPCGPICWRRAICCT